MIFIVRKFPSSSTSDPAMLHRRGEFLVSSTWVDFCCCFLYWSMFVIGITTSWDTGRRREKELMEKTNKFHLKFCCLLLWFIVHFVAEKINNSLLLFMFQPLNWNAVLHDWGSPPITVHALGRTFIHLSHSFISLCSHYVRSKTKTMLIHFIAS